MPKVPLQLTQTTWSVFEEAYYAGVEPLRVDTDGEVDAFVLMDAARVQNVNESDANTKHTPNTNTLFHITLHIHTAWDHTEY